MLVYIRNGIVAHQLDPFAFAEGIECISLEVSLNKRKWVLLNVYRPPTQSEEILLDNLGRANDKYNGEFENFIILGDINMTINEGEDKCHLLTFGKLSDDSFSVTIGSSTIANGSEENC